MGATSKIALAPRKSAPLNVAPLNVAPLNVAPLNVAPLKYATLKFASLKFAQRKSVSRKSVELHDAGNTISFTPTSGQCVMFPGWQYHAVAPYRGNAPRISVAFNLDPVIHK